MVWYGIFIWTETTKDYVSDIGCYLGVYAFYFLPPYAGIVIIHKSRGEVSLKVTFFRKYDSFLKSANHQNKSVPENYPELEI